ncbi:2-succinyl-5-enolpyruvyl-6-hydroxy-3-cyclohexene-1-carboxylic-acid synthase [Gracilibacillus sp. S3-1-1]|uniref:2-succinyl-5-enolpyruvyl-6-hydroxy-3-cyclohexene-1-carboxylic-acid synthase n=1 Tax=Gracilibacillus pellucidus TaxID=3095368 RepID=A0ACC6M1L6_9BACI|nr:2-succinyl-5-enolpyruvyl-6-hydroxy-3-cyclohexene-1-carboxylic-acid synthase [Gracilibacillus sp. S3-1-1]MDX8044791.1 2-succinyl-5-enolpyruvyl-6-hydroxy-3-cyclohexene-1-carboxylic-acid synthase [Gracilibacillus sp. S3-1-1]
MSHTEALSRYIGHFVDQLFKSGVRDVVISPGSRSTPLSLAFAEYDRFQITVDIDERSASYFALGIVKQTNNPVVLVCSSGTAVANYFPAIIEAYQARVPLIVLTADRPHELRSVGAPQAIDQIKIFGDYVKSFHEMAMPEMNENMLQYARNHADRAVRTSLYQVKGPVHLNFPFREPLIPDFRLEGVWGDDTAYVQHFQSDETRLSPQVLANIEQQLQNKKRGVIVCGPHDYPALGAAILSLAKKWQLPVLADPLSSMRVVADEGVIVETYDSILKSKQVRSQINIDFIIRFGAMPVSKPVLQLLQENEIEQFIIDEDVTFRNPAIKQAHYMYGKPTNIANQLADLSLTFDEDWLATWQQMNHAAKAVLNREQQVLTEGLAVRGIQHAIPDESTLFVGNSMPIRDVDTFWLATAKKITIHANRGANGIDGIISTALGMAKNGNHVTLLIGDISFLHSMNGLLLTKNYPLNVTIVLINNQGGGIFSFLPQAKEDNPHYEMLFGTPQSISFEKVAVLYDFPYTAVKEWSTYLDALKASYEKKGVSLIEVQTDRQENVEWHQQNWQEIEQSVLAILR